MWIIGSFVPNLVHVFSLGLFSASAVTAGPFIFSRTEPSDSLRRHELTHVKQWADWMILGFLAALVLLIGAHPWWAFSSLFIAMGVDWLLYFVFQAIYTVIHWPEEVPARYREAGYSKLKFAITLGYLNNPMEREADYYGSLSGFEPRPAFGWLRFLRSR